MFRAMSRRSSRITDYFTNAVRAWIFEGDEVGRDAALAAAITATTKQRASMLQYLDALTDDLLEAEDGTKGLLLVGLAKDITEKDWSGRDSARARTALADRNKDYADALDRADPTIFAKKFPKLFK